jgi:HAD superfamily hydrolase (TIGR01509 family)
MVETNKYAFDLEGPLVNLESWHQCAFEEVAGSLGVVFGAAEFKKFVGAGDKAISEEIAMLSKSTGRPIDPVEIRGLKNVIYRDILYSSDVSPREGVSDYLEKARFVGGDLVIASLTPRDDAVHILQKSGLAPFFKYTLTEDDVMLLKPDPEVYLASVRLLNARPNMVLVHEDSPTGVKAAKAAGSHVAAFPVHESLEFDPEPDAIYFSWVDLDPNEIYNRLVKQSQT